MIRPALALLLAAPLLAAAPEPAPAPACPFAGQAPRLIVQLYFGQSIAGRGRVSHRAWERFVVETLAPALPGGFTVLEGSGRFFDPATGGTGAEPSVLVIAAGEDTPVFHARVGQVVDAYRRRFDQGSVGVVSAVECAVF